MRRPVQLALGGTGLVAIAIALLAAGSIGTGTSSPPQSTIPVRASAPKNSLDNAIAVAQKHLTARPTDSLVWAQLGIAYVQKAKQTSDPSFYIKAEGAVAKSLQLDRAANFEGYAGQASLQNARHDFRGAEASARKGLAIDSYSATLQGALGDSLTQLGRYDQAAAVINRMNQLRPGVPAFTRASYVFELRGDVPNARATLQRALQDASNPGDISFVQYYLGELDLRYGGGTASALQHYQAGLDVNPGDSTVRAGHAKALAAQGKVQQALQEYHAVVAAVPQPQYVLELAELEQSIGDPDAQRQYQLFRTEEQLYRAGGVALDTEQTLFEADHGNPKTALVYAAKGWAVRPFVEMADAYAWAEHVNGNDAAALVWSQRSFVSGWKPALQLFHRGMIEKALGQRAKAKADLTQALRLDPAFNRLQAPVAKKALAELS